MIGTIVNTCTIIVGSIVGAAMNQGIKEKYKDTLYTGLGLACLGIGLNAVISISTIAKVLSTAISEAIMPELLIVGGLMIVASGLSLLKLKDCKTLNMLPSLLVPVLWFLVKSLI